MTKKHILGFAVFFGMLYAVFCPSAARAGDGSPAPSTQEQIAALNAAIEQVFQAIPPPGQKVAGALIDKVYTKGTVPVIVRLREEDQPFGIFVDKTAVRSQVIGRLQRAVIDDVLAHTPRKEAALHVKRFQLIPAMVLQIDPNELETLTENPNVIDIVEDKPVPLALQDSVPLLGAAPDDSFGGYTGDGWTVAILDTGVDKNHPFLSGKVVSEACYSTNYPTQGATSLCPGGVTASTAPNSGLHCTGVLGCNHGTHVAGIAAGKGSTFSGVARDASIIAIQVFSRFDSESICGFNNTPCLMSYVSDQVLALEHVYALRNTYQIASANMSLSGGIYASYCDSEYQKPAIDILRSAGIATVIASGNDSVTNGLGSPSCISTAVSVGSTSKTDVVSSFSNSASFLSLLAPGGSIFSSLPGSSYGTMSGTSMASPHVAGAWAVLKQAYPVAGVTEVLEALQATGVPVIDTRSGAGGRSKPRIDVASSLDFLICADNTNCPEGYVCMGGSCRPSVLRVKDTGDAAEQDCNPHSYTDFGNGIVLDNTTGLEWMQATAPGKYSWQQALNYVAGMNAGSNPNYGYTDWRLPSVGELSTLADKGRYNPAINTAYFPNTMLSGYWSSTACKAYSDYAFYVDFGYGGGVSYELPWSSIYYVRAVRGEPYRSFYNFVSNGDGTVTDRNTSLVWQHCNYGQNWDGFQCTGSSGTRTWQQALSYVQALNTSNYLGYSDWRLPTSNELQSIIDYNRYSPATRFPNMLAGRYWSSTAFPGSTVNAWYVDFYEGVAGPYGKSSTYYVRVVRGGPCRSNGDWCIGDGDCADAVFCNGAETCAEGMCAESSSPCTQDQICDEAGGRCVECFINGDCSEGSECVEGTCVPVTDTDLDGFVDGEDNCPAKCNPQQKDADGDGIGDVCDTAPGCGGCGQATCEVQGQCDSDNDGIADSTDNCPAKCNTQQKDADDDGIGDVCDTSPGCGGCGQTVCEVACTP